MQRIEELTKLVLKGEMRPETQSVEFEKEDIFLPPLIKDAKRIYEYVVAQKPVLTEYSAMTGLLIFDGSVPGDGMSIAGLKNVQEMCNLFYARPIDRLVTFEWQHATADYRKIIHKGMEGQIADIEASKMKHAGEEKAQEFLDALKIVANALVAWAAKCADEAYELAQKQENPEYRTNLLLLAESLRKVPTKPASTFYEAILSIYVCFSYDPDSLGTLDRTLYEYYIRDLEAGILTREKAKEYLQELFLMLQSRIPITSDRFTRGGESHFSVGGYLPDGSDGFTDLSLLMLEAMTELPTYIPQITLRWTAKLPFETFLKVLDLERKDSHKRIAFVNDDVKIPRTMEHWGFSFEEACSYTTLGCNEVAYPGGMVGGNSNSNGLRSMEITFHQRTDEILQAETFEEFFAVYRRELCADLDQILAYDDRFNLVRSRDYCLVTSLFFDGCIQKAKTYTQGACSLARAGSGMVGITNMIDSLAVVKQFVYDEKMISMQTLADALKANWHGYEELRTLIEKKGKFFGNDDETSNYVARLLTETIYEHLKDKTNIWGYKLGLGNLQGYNPHHEWFGSRTKATPDGRRDGEKLKFGLGQNDGRDRNGLTALLNSVAKCDPHGVITAGSSVTNLYLDEKLIKDDDYFGKTARLLETYFKNGGTHFQLNYVSKEELVHAKTRPEEYKSLRVRVSGFADYFVNLTESVQDDVIARTEHAR